MEINIVNGVASIVINIDANSRTISKDIIREISLIRETLLKIDIGGGISGNIYLPVADVRNPAHTDANNLCAILNDYLTASEEELNTNVSEVKILVSEIKTQVSGVGSDVNNVDTLVRDINNQVDNVSTQVSNVSTQSGTINTRVSNLSADVSSIAAVVSTIQSQVLFITPLLRDENNPVKIYCGYAPIGTAPSAAGWAILKIWNVGNIISYLWADGNRNFDNVWDNRSALTYS